MLDIGGLGAMLLIKGATLGGLIVVTSGITICITAGLLFRQAKDAGKQASNIIRLIVLLVIDKLWLSGMEEEKEEEEEEEKRRY